MKFASTHVPPANQSPLNYQNTEFSCVPTSFENALLYLLGRSEYRPELVKVINVHALDISDVRFIKKDGRTALGKTSKSVYEVGSGGTSNESIDTICKNLDIYKKNNFDPLSCQYIQGDQVNANTLKEKLTNQNTVALTNVQLGKIGHYVLITKADRKHAYIFDPYFIHNSKEFNTKNVKIINDHIFEYNRKVPLTHLFQQESTDYMMGKNPRREMVFLSYDLSR